MPTEIWLINALLMAIETKYHLQPATNDKSACDNSKINALTANKNALISHFIFGNCPIE